MRGLSYKDCSLLSLFNQVFSESNLDLGLCKGNYDNCSTQIMGKSATDRHNKRGKYQIISG
jgi:hypothetical protein